MQHIRIGQDGADFFRDNARLFGGLGFIRIQFAEHHHKLIAAETRDGIRLAHTAGKAARRFDQQQVAHVMPMRIVERLEVIQIEKHQRAITAAALAGGHDRPEPVIEQAAVGQLRQRIVESQIANLLLGLFALGDVLHSANAGKRRPFESRSILARSLTQRSCPSTTIRCSRS